MTTLNIQGREVEVSDDFLSLSPDEQNATVDEIAAQMNIQPQGQKRADIRFLGQANAAIAEGVGGLVDFVNPFSEPTQLLGVPIPSTGSAVEGLRAGMEAIGAEVATEPPQTVLEGLGRGTGAAAAAILPVVKGLQGLRGVGGAVGAFADDAVRALTTTPGLLTEAAAGAVGGGTREIAREAGAPEVVQNLAEIAAPALALPGAIASIRAARRIPGVAPVSQLTARGVQATRAALTPMTKEGAELVAGRRVRELVGDRERAEALSQTIDPNDPLSLTPAQQTGDPNLLGLERQAATENPLLRERLSERAAASKAAAEKAVTEIGGDVSDARSFFSQRLQTFSDNMGNAVARVLNKGDADVSGIGPVNTETRNSTKAVRKIKESLDTNLAEESRLWNEVPKGALVSSEISREAVEDFIASVPRAQQDDIPAVARRLLGRTSGKDVSPAEIQDVDSVAEMHGLYSELRRVARTAMAGTDQNKNKARIANEIADAILRDLGATNPDTPVGVAINNARAFSRALHETFDQGAVGRILRRTVKTDEAIPAEAALKKTVGRGGPEAKVDARQIRAAAQDTQLDIDDFVRGKFADAVLSPDGTFTPKTAATFMRNNREMLADFPDLRKELTKALGSRNAAAMFETRGAARTKLAENKSALARFQLGQEEKAVLSIIGADDPAKTAKNLVSAARKDKTGLALRGVKAAFTDYLIGGATKGEELSGRQLTALLGDRNTIAAMRQVFSGGEMSRISRVAQELAKTDPTKVADVGAVLDTPANKILGTIVRIAAARQGGAIGGGSFGGSLQTANIAVERSRAILRGLTNNRARQMLMDAIEDPELFKTLLETTESISVSPATRSRLAPYLTAAVGGLADEDEEGPR